MSCTELVGDMMFMPHPDNISTVDVSDDAPAAATLTVQYEPQPVPHWHNATRVKKLSTVFNITHNILTKVGDRLLV